MAKKTVDDYLRTTAGICLPNLNLELSLSTTITVREGWYGWLNSLVKTAASFPVMGHCVYESNRLYNQYMIMISQRESLKLKTMFYTASTLGVVGIWLFQRSVRRLSYSFTRIAAYIPRLFYVRLNSRDNRFLLKIPEPLLPDHPIPDFHPEL
jgi:hypothetical protein